IEVRLRGEQEADRELDRITNKPRTARIDARAESREAENELDRAARDRFSVINATAPNTWMVDRQLDDLASPREAPIHAFLRRYPTAKDIADTIGVVQVPVDAYLRSTPRTTGVY